MINDTQQDRPATVKSWVRIPDGTKVRHRSEGHEGFIDGLTEIVIGQTRNPDRRTQYRMNVGEPSRKLAAEEDLLILTDHDGVVLMAKQKVEYRSSVTEMLRVTFSDDRFVRCE